jgi:chlorite dismutase
VTEQNTFVYYPVYWANPWLRERPDPEYFAFEIEKLFKEREGRVAIRGVYSTAGFNPRAELMMWWTAPTAEDIQEMARDFRRTLLGRSLHQSHSFLGVHRPPETAPDHLPAFMRGEPPRRYMCVYPFVRTPEWYLLPKDKRAALLAEHGEMGRKFPGVLPNTTSAFGLGDWEWILAFEADDLIELVDCIRYLRNSESRLYVKKETPFITGIRKDLAEVIADVV